MSNSLTRIIGEYILAPAAAVGVTLLSTTAFADDGVRGGTFVPGGSGVAAPTVPAPASPPAAPPKRVARKRVAAPAVRAHEHPHGHADYEAQIADLQERVQRLAESSGQADSDLAALQDSLEGLRGQLDDHYNNELALHGVVTGRLNTNERLMGEIVESFFGLVNRLEQYEASMRQAEAVTTDPALQYMLPIFRNGMQELTRSRAEMLSACRTAYASQRELTDSEAIISRERASLSDKVRALESDASLDDHARMARAIGLRQQVEKYERLLPHVVARAAKAREQCEEAKTDYDALQKELPARIQRNIFGKDSDTRRIWLEAGAQAGYRGAAAGAVVAAVTYRGDSVTVGLGGGAGYGEAVRNTSDLDPVAQSQPQGDYREESSMTGTETTTDRYRGHAQLRVGTPWARGQKWVPGVSGIVDLTVSDREVAVARTRTSQLYDADNQPAGDEHEVSCGTESNDACPESGSTRSYGVAPGFAVDLFRDGNRDGYAVGVRGTVQIDVNNRRPDFTLSLLGTF